MTKLEEIFGEGHDAPKLKLTIHSKRNNIADMRIRSHIDQLVNVYCLTLSSFVRELQDWMEQTSMGNHANFWIHYKIVGIIEGKPAERDTHAYEFESVDVWHNNTHDELDRKVCSLSQIGKEATDVR